MSNFPSVNRGTNTSVQNYSADSENQTSNASHGGPSPSGPGGNERVDDAASPFDTNHQNKKQ